MKLNSESIITFGIHKGKKLKDVPCDYLLTLYKKRIAFGCMLEYIHNNLDVLNAHSAINNKRTYFDKKYFLGK